MISAPVYDNVDCLIVDRDPHTRKTIQQYLRQTGIRKLREAEKPEPAITHIRKAYVELIIADWESLVSADEMLLQNIRNRARARGRFAFVVTTNDPRESYIMHAINNDADAILCKPFSASLFWTHVGRALDARKARIQAASAAMATAI